MFATIVDHVVPPSVDVSILYPVIAEPPLFDGSVQERLICDEDIAAVVRPVGDCGAVLDVPALAVVADDVVDGELVPTKLIADTR